MGQAERDEVSLVPFDVAATDMLQQLPNGWTTEHDETLIQFLQDQKKVMISDGDLVNIKTYVESIEVSSYSVGFRFCISYITIFL